ncbi:MAG: hypothetical protein M1818_008040 [Claussenomyces sp. TS43310]|nr:MAG: hypothetical protein M1818_008040 [Claussenomyces sp. TS43310]
MEGQPRLIQPRLPAKSAASSEVTDKVLAWLQTQSCSPPPESSFRTGHQDFSLPISIASGADERKKVLFTPSVIDNEGKTQRTLKAKRMTGRSGRRIADRLQSDSCRLLPQAPEPPRSRDPPPTPRIERLPTPDFSESKHANFCSCCSGDSFDKMQDQLRFATQHMAAAKRWS